MQIADGASAGLSAAVPGGGICVVQASQSRGWFQSEYSSARKCLETGLCHCHRILLVEQRQREPRCKEGEVDLISLWEKGQTIWDNLFLNFHTCEQCVLMNGYISSPHQTQIISLIVLYWTTQLISSVKASFFSSPPMLDIVFHFVVLQLAFL